MVFKGPKSELDFNKDDSTKATYQETSEQEVKQRLKSYAGFGLIYIDLGLRFSI